MRSGAVGSIYDSFTASYLALFLKALGASNTWIGLLSAVPFIAQLLAEVPGAKLLEYFSRKSIILFSVAVRSIWFFIALAPYLLQQNVIVGIILLFFIFKICDLIGEPAWVTFLADIIPNKVRGRFFSKRFMVMSLFSSIATMLAGFYLGFFKNSIAGFASMFFIGTIVGISVNTILKKIKDPDNESVHHHAFKEFLLFDGTFRTFCIFVFFFNFAYMIASPFFNIYIVADLGLSYDIFGILAALATITKILAQSHIGKIADKYGDKHLAVISIICTAVVPLLYLFATKENPWWIISAQIMSGFAWAGVDLTILNLLLDFTDKEKRTVQIATYNVFTSIPLIIAPIIGGYIADNLTFIWAGIPLVFAISLVLRAVSPLFILHLKEPRIDHQYSIFKVFKETLSLHPLQGLRNKVVVKQEKKLI